jgi:hypothetical protein
MWPAVPSVKGRGGALIGSLRESLAAPGRLPIEHGAAKESNLPAGGCAGLPGFEDPSGHRPPATPGEGTDYIMNYSTLHCECVPFRVAASTTTAQ